MLSSNSILDWIKTPEEEAEYEAMFQHAIEDSIKMRDERRIQMNELKKSGKKLPMDSFI